jgi:hypothetical protein
MPKLTSPLDHVKIAAPCPADWDQMFSFEDERVRFCSQCNLNVYNLSNMSRQEAEALITKTEGRLCVRFYRKADGSILTQNCPVGLKALKYRVARVARVVLGVTLSLVSGFGLYIFHLGRKPYPPLNPLNYRSTSTRPIICIWGNDAASPRSSAGEIGEVRIEQGQSELGTHNKAKIQGRSIIQVEPSSSSATSPSPSRKNP